MKTKIILLVLCFIITVALAAGAVFLSKGHTDAVSASIDRGEPDFDVQTYDEDFSVIFYDLDDYVSYVTGAEFNASPNRLGSASIHYYYPRIIPEGVSLMSVEITDEGTIFTFDTSGCMTRDPVFDIYQDDDAISELVSISRIKYYDSNYYINSITNKSLYLSRLAAAIEAPPVTGFTDVYLGDVVMNVEQTDHSFIPVLVGRQTVAINWDNIIQYTYSAINVPISITEQLADMQLITVGADSDSDNS